MRTIKQIKDYQRGLKKWSKGIAQMKTSKMLYSSGRKYFSYELKKEKKSESVSCSVHRVLQARILERVVTPFSRGSSRPRDQSQVSCTAGRFFTTWATREAKQLATGEGYSKRRELHVQRSAEELEMEGQRGYTGSGEEGNGMRGRESFLEVLAQFTKYVTSCLCPDAA